MMFKCVVVIFSATGNTRKLIHVGAHDCMFK